MTFEESTLNGTRCWYLHVWPTPEEVVGTAPYQARFDEIDESTVQSASLDNNCNEWAMRKQLSEAVFREAYRLIGRRIVSSRRWVEGAGEWRTDLAEHMWQRFERSGLARYVPAEDRFVYQPPYD